MNNYDPAKLNKVRRKVSGTRGMTMAEMLITVSIILILAAVAFISVMNYQRNLAQLERDKTAKELYYAAQNHLTSAKGEGYLDLEKDVTEETANDIIGYPDTVNSVNGVYYFVYPGNSYTETKSSILDLMLPFGSIDETIRIGGSYIIRYHLATGRVMDVFYCSRSGSPKKFNHPLTTTDFTKGIVASYAGDDKRDARRKFDNAVLGWYGGANGSGWENPDVLDAPDIEVKNEEQLYVKVTDNISGDHSLKLIITGENSGAQKSYRLVSDSSLPAEQVTVDPRITKTGGTFKIVLDDITAADMHFADIEAENGKQFTPGENIKIQAVAYSLKRYTSIEYSAEKTTNSLFADNGKSGVSDIDTAYVSNMRHLENVDSAVSNLNANNGSHVSTDTLRISKAVQTANLYWSDSDASTKDFVTGIKALKSSSTGPQIFKYDSSDASTDEGYYLPTKLSGFSYDGAKYSIVGVKAKSNVDGNSGLFGSLADCTVKNIKLIDFDINATSDGGALAGKISQSRGTNMEVTNVIAINSESENRANEKKVVVTAGNAGGLIGNMDGGNVQFSAAAIRVSGTNAGGLIGASSGTVTGCYSGGHTEKGSYQEWVEDDDKGYDVVGSSTAGGLIGSAGSTTISNSYSTCSVSGDGNTVRGGFVGSSSGTISNCYAVGLVETKEITKKDDHTVNGSIGSFAGSFTGSVPENKDCYYFSSINEVMLKEKKNGKDKYTMDHYVGAVGDEGKDNVRPFDSSTATYEKFVGGTWQAADPYDSDLKKYYQDKYNLKTVKQLYGSGFPEGYDSWPDYFIKIHHGDWPAPEAFFLNTES